MVGHLEIGKSKERFKEECVTSIFYRLEKYIDEYGCKDVYEFYTVNNGYMYYRRHEETDGNLGYIYKDVKLGENAEAKQKGNALYNKLKREGYMFAGIYQCDICGYSKRIK